MSHKAHCNRAPKRITLLGAALAACLFSGPSALAKEHHVTIQNMKFVPEVVEASPGDSIVWKNTDIVPHTVTAKSKFDSGMLNSGQTYVLKPTEGGTTSYVCLYHPMMKGKIVVKKAP